VLSPLVRLIAVAVSFSASQTTGAGTVQVTKAFEKKAGPWRRNKICHFFKLPMEWHTPFVNMKQETIYVAMLFYFGFASHVSFGIGS
jgi:hypothetical protein